MGRAGRLDDAQFQEMLASCDAFKSEAREVQRGELLVHDQLGDGAASGGRVLQSVSREASADEEVPHLWVGTDDGVLFGFE